MHSLIFYGFIIFFIATSLVGIDYSTPWRILKGDFYLGFESVVNAFALLFLIDWGWPPSGATSYGPISSRGASGEAMPSSWEDWRSWPCPACRWR